MRCTGDIHFDQGILLAIFPIDCLGALDRGTGQEAKVSRHILEDDLPVFRVDALLHDLAPCPESVYAQGTPEPARWAAYHTSVDFYVNGQMVAPTEATIAVEDAGLQHSVGLFETFGARNGRIFRLQEHLQRMAQSSHDLGFCPNLDTKMLAAAVSQTISHNRILDARIRVTLTAGAVSLLHAASKPIEPTVLVTPTIPTRYAPEYFSNGIAVVIAGPLANPFDPMAGHKTLAYWQRLRSLRHAASQGAGETVWLSVSNHLVSGAVSNLFLVRDGCLLTPIARGEEVPNALPAPVLPGVIRGTIIEIAQALGLDVYRRTLNIDDLLEADELFLTNSSWWVLPITRVEAKTIGPVGPLTCRLRKALLDRVEKESV